MIPDFKTFIKESLWADLEDRSSGDVVRREDIAAELKIDGVKYSFTKNFMEMGEVYNEENSDEWTCFAFNKMPNGSNIISGDTELAGTFGIDKWDIGDDQYDVYVLKAYMDYSKEELIESALDNLGNNIYFVQDILKKYIVDVFEHHMSDYAKFWIYELNDSDMSNNMVISFCEGTYYSEVDAILDEFEGQEIEDANLYLYPALDGWYEGLEKELTEAYEKEGWVKSKTYEPNWLGEDIPGGTLGLCFVKLK